MRDAQAAQADRCTCSEMAISNWAVFGRECEAVSEFPGGGVGVGRRAVPSPPSSGFGEGSHAVDVLLPCRRTVTRERAFGASPGSAGSGARSAAREAHAMTGVRDHWAAGSSYEDFMGRWSRLLAPAFVSWLQVPRGVHWLDVGCGTGALSAAVCSHADPASVMGCDPATPFVEFARERSRDARQSFVIAGVGNLPRRPGGYGSVTSLLALNFLPDAEGAVHEMRSVAAPRATVSACVWDYGAGMSFLRHFWDAAASQDSAASALDEGNRFALCRRDALTALFRDCGLSDVHCEPIEIGTAFASFEDYWRPFLGGTGPAPSYVASLGADRRAILKQKLEETLRRGPDGTITLTARAWAVRGAVS